MINVLSIDWDYYIDTTKEVRYKCFPKMPKDIISENERTKMWEEFYETYHINNIGILDNDFYKTQELIHSINKHSKHLHKKVNDSHRYVYDVIKQEIIEHRDEDIEVYNIDFHHDMYQYRTSNEKVNCGNWADILQNELGNEFQYNWIKREDSEEYSLAGKVECKECSIEEIDDKDFNILYLCKSGAWTPPHLDDQYEELKSFVLET